MTAYDNLEKRFARLNTLGEAAEILGWDQAVNMPDGAAPGRAEQMALLAALHHEMLADPAVAEWLDAAEADADVLGPWERANLGEMRREWVHSNAVPADLVEALTHAASDCEMVWRAARKADDFAAVAPKLKALLALVREQASAKADRLGCSRYDALLDMYEPGGRSARIDAVFADLETFLPPFVERALDHQARAPEAVAPQGPFPVERQKALGLKLMEIVGFEFDHGRLDVSHHPFCGGTPDDVRITTRYDETDFTSALMGVLHETGHGLYERGLPGAWRRQPVGRARGMSVHESQSLLMEMQACRSREFIAFAAPLMREAFDGRGAAWEEDNLRRLYAKVERGFIRVNADEATYPAHVILRYRLEKALIAGEMEVEDLPGAWREGMRTLLGVVPSTDREGCLQDIHWYDGAFGYFPTYTLGAMTAAQLFDAAKTADPAILPGIARGDFKPLLTWLRTNVHAKASSLPVDDLLTEATGRPLDAAVFKAHLTARYL